MRGIRFLVVGTLWLGGCALQSAGKGEACARSNQCTPGFVCVQGACSDNLASIMKQSKVPNLMPDAGKGDAGKADGSAGDGGEGDAGKRDAGDSGVAK